MRRWYWFLIRDFSGDFSGERLGKGGLGNRFSRVLATNASATAATAADVLGLVAGREVVVLKGKGGGARSGSDESHMGTDERLDIDSEKEG